MSLSSSDLLVADKDCFPGSNWYVAKGQESEGARRVPARAYDPVHRVVHLSASYSHHGLVRGGGAGSDRWRAGGAEESEEPPADDLPFCLWQEARVVTVAKADLCYVVAYIVALYTSPHWRARRWRQKATSSTAT